MALERLLVMTMTIVMFFIGIPGVIIGLQFLVYSDLPIDVILETFIIVACGLAIIGIGVILLLKLQTAVEILVNPKNKNRLLAMTAVILVLPVWLVEFPSWTGINLTVNMIPVSSVIVMIVAVTFSLVSWSLLCWASKNITPSGILLGIITGASLAGPFLNVLGPLAGVMIGVVGGVIAWMLQQRLNDPQSGLLGAAMITLLSAYLALIAIIESLNYLHVWNAGGGIGEWSGTAEGIEYGFVTDIGFEFFLVVIPAWIIAVLVIRGRG